MNNKEEKYNKIIKRLNELANLIDINIAILTYLFKRSEKSACSRKLNFYQGVTTNLKSFFVNEFIALEDHCKLGLTGNMLGDIEVIEIDQEFYLSPYFEFTGEVTLQANRKDLEFEGGTRLAFECDKFRREWIRFNGVIDPVDVAIPVDSVVKEMMMSPVRKIPA